MNKEWFDVTSKMAENAQQSLNKMNEANTRIMETLFSNQTSMMNDSMQAWQKGFDKLTETKDMAEAGKVQSETARACGEIVMGAFKENIAAMNAAREEFGEMFEENAKSATEFAEKLADKAAKETTKRTRKTT